MRSPTSTAEDGFTLTPTQRNFLQAAKAWWQEGERSLDYLAEKSRQETILGQLRPHFTVLRTENHPTGALIDPIVKLSRKVTANRALNRTLQTDAFATALRDLLFGNATLPQRLERFLQAARIGPQTASHLLYTAFPDQFPLVSPVTKATLGLSVTQGKQIRAEVLRQYQLLPDSVSGSTLALLTDFAIYETVRRFLGLTDFTELNAVLWHAREMPREAKGKSKGRASVQVQEEEATYVPAPEPTEAELVRYIEGYIAAQGFTFPSLTVRNYYIALKAKPFVLLTGLSGTGKTRLTRLLADALTGNTSGQYLLLPVRPDWTDSAPLLGYHNPVTDRYVSTPFLELLQTAARTENRERAFFACLDEMNLARVEHYFADLLSAMETQERTVLLYEGRTATLPENVFLTGSVNLDEATHPFSRKVLDRANTLEFSEVRLNSMTDSPAPQDLPQIPPPDRQRLFLASRVLTIGEATTRLAVLSPTFPDQVLTTLAELNDLLSPRGLHFGYRVRDEALRYIAASFTAEGIGLLDPEPEDNLRTALDLQILQKVLPRLSGTQEALDRLLRELTTWAETFSFFRTAAKLARIRSRAAEDGIVTFYEL